MNVIIIEDEWAAQEQLKSMLEDIVDNINIIRIIGTVKEAIDFFQTQAAGDLIFMDIHLSDGNSLEIFNHVNVSSPIIFTTAYDQYAIQAFKHNSIDYLLKPIVIEDLQYSIKKFNSLKPSLNQSLLESIYKSFNETKEVSYKNSLLIQKKDRLYPVDCDSISAFYIEDSLVKCITFDKEIHNLTHTLDELENMLKPSLFFRASRQYILNRKAIKHLSIHFNGKLKVQCNISLPTSIIVSRIKSNELKEWLNI